MKVTVEFVTSDEDGEYGATFDGIEVVKPCSIQTLRVSPDEMHDKLPVLFINPDHVRTVLVEKEEVQP